MWRMHVTKVTGNFKLYHAFFFFVCVCHVDYAAAQYRQYQRLTKQMKPSVDEYSREKDQK